MSTSNYAQSLFELSEGLTRYINNIPKSTLNSALRKGAKPMLTRLQASVPVSKGGRTRIAVKQGRNNRNANAYRRGGAMRQDLRIKLVKGRALEVARVVVGVSKRKDKVGWRAPFITAGTADRRTRNGAFRGRVTKNDFLTKAYRQEIEGLRTSFTKEFEVAFQRWAKKNLPQQRP